MVVVEAYFNYLLPLLKLVGGRWEAGYGACKREKYNSNVLLSEYIVATRVATSPRQL